MFFVAAEEAPAYSQDEANFADEATSDLGSPSEAEAAGSVSSEPAGPGAAEPTGTEAEGAPSE